MLEREEYQDPQGGLSDFQKKALLFLEDAVAKSWMFRIVDAWKPWVIGKNPAWENVNKVEK